LQAASLREDCFAPQQSRRDPDVYDRHRGVEDVDLERFSQNWPKIDQDGRAYSM
jgi:hypothetical protein